MPTPPARHHRGAAPTTLRGVPARPALAAAELDVYHVIFAPGDVRRVTLDQLDDFYRLGVVNEGTHVWTKGMDEWQTLASAAGLNEQEVAPVQSTSQPPPSPRARAAVVRVTSHAPPPPSVRRARALAATSLAPGSAPTVAQSPSPRTSQRPAAVASQPPSDWMQSRPAPRLAVSPQPMPATSLSPGATDSLDMAVYDRAGRLRSRVQAGLVWGSVIIGTLITLYRNDALLVGARSLQQGDTYLALEKRWLGGAPSGTPREVLTRTQPEPETTTPAAVTTAPTDATAPGQPLQPFEGDSADVPPAPKTGSQGPDEPGGEQGKATPAPSSAQQRTALVAHSKRVAPSAKRTTVTTKTRVAVEATPAKPEAAAPAPGTDAFLRLNMAQAVERSGKAAASKRPNKVGGAYDPLNGDL